MAKFSFDDISIEGANISNKEKSDGSFDVIVGAYNVFSSEGAFYVMNDNVKRVFSSNGQVGKALSMGMKSEENHPTMKYTDTIEEFAERFKSIDESNTCGIFNSISLDSNPTKVSFQEQPVYLVRANITPLDNDLGRKLRGDLLDQTTDVAFSLRGMSHRTTINGILYKETYFVVTYDRVPRPGIAVARQSQWLDFDIESKESLIPDNELSKLLSFANERLKNDTEDDYSIGFYSAVKDIITGCDDNSCILNTY